jgi:hypothetical protein
MTARIADQRDADAPFKLQQEKETGNTLVADHHTCPP